MASLRKNGYKNQARAGPGRGKYWEYHILEIWFQQTASAECRINGEVRPSLDFRFQLDENSKGDLGKDQPRSKQPVVSNKVNGTTIR